MATGRKPVPTTEHQGPDFVSATPLEIVAQEKQVREILRGEDLVMKFEETHRQLGQIDAFEFTRRVADVAIAQIFENLRNSGKYKGLPYKDGEGNTRHVASLDEFCDVKLGKSYRRCLDLSQNLRLLGPELYEQSERLGLRNLDYKALRALPDAEQEIVKRALEENTSREGLIDLIQEMAVKAQRDKESLAQQLQAKDTVIESKQKLIDHQADEIDGMARKVRFVATATPEERHEGIRTELLGYAAAVEGLLAGKLKPCFSALKENLEENGGEVDAYLSSTLGQIERAVRELREEFGLLRAADVAWAAE